MKDMWETRMKETERGNGGGGGGQGMERMRRKDGEAYENDVCVAAVDIDAPDGH